MMKKKNEEDKKIIKINAEIKNHFGGEVSMKEFKYYENLFNKYKNKIKENEDKDSKIIEKFLQIMKNLLMIILKLFNYSYKIKLFL